MDIIQCQALRIKRLDLTRQLLLKLVNEYSHDFTAREQLDLCEAVQAFQTPMQGFDEALLNSLIHHLYCSVQGIVSKSIMTEKDVEFLDQQNWCCYSDDDPFRSPSFEILSMVETLAVTRSDETWR
jgi:hypothetical protein